MEKHTISICTGRACKLFGTDRITRQVKEQTGLAPGEESDSIRVQHVPCMGICSYAPNMQVNDNEPMKNVSDDDVTSAVKSVKDVNPSQLIDDNPDTYAEAQTGNIPDAERVLDDNNFLGDL